MRSVSAVTVPIRAVPGWWLPSRDDRGGVGGGHDGAEPAAHVEDLPHLGLGHLAELPDELEHRRHRERGADLEADVGLQAQQVENPPPVMCASPRTSTPERSSSSTART